MIKTKIMIIAGVLILGLGVSLVGGAYWTGKKAGMAERDVSNAKALELHARRETELLDKLNSAGQKIKVVYRDKIKIIESASGECLDSFLPANIISSVQ